MRVRLPPEPCLFQVAMTPSEYLSINRFPLTSTPGASLKEQILCDATLFDQYQELKDKGEAFSPEQKSKLLELEIKIPHATRLIAQAWSRDPK